MNANETTQAHRIDEEARRARREWETARADAIRLLKKVAANAARDAATLEAEPTAMLSPFHRLDSDDGRMTDLIARQQAATQRLDLLAYLSGAKE